MQFFIRYLPPFEANHDRRWSSRGRLELFEANLLDEIGDKIEVQAALEHLEAQVEVSDHVDSEDMILIPQAPMSGLGGWCDAVVVRLSSVIDK